MSNAQLLVASGEVQPAKRVDDYPNPPRDLKTVMMHTLGFVGSITIEASIMTHPGDDDWFQVRVETFAPLEPRQEAARNRFFNSRDRIVWMRATVDKVQGRVDRISVI